MFLTSAAATWFFPFVLPICIWAAWTDLKWMKILNITVMTLAGVFLIVGLIALPFDVYLWRLLHLALVLLVGMAMNAARMIGAGDAKFMAAAAPFIAVGDVFLVLIILATSMVIGYTLHRIAKHTPLRKLAPDWESWTKDKKFPMGLCLGATLAIYLGLGLVQGA